MIKVGLYTEDRLLQPLLSSAMGKEYLLLPESDTKAINSLALGRKYNVLLLDLTSNHHSLQERIEFSRYLIASNVPLVVMANDDLRSTAFELLGNGAFGYCRRPPSIRDLKNLLTRAHENSSLRQQLQAAQPGPAEHSSCDGLFGSSPSMMRVYGLVRSVANLNASILITGESGTGKELIARAIHNLGSRASRPFVAISCSAIPETLIEAELFGHQKGAFTGTVGAREGYFEQAADGTLFLDEIGDLSLFTQSKLLRVLQQMEFCRLGSTRLVPLRAHLIFATNHDLAKLVVEGKFRQDLFYRINVMQIGSPPLREHPEDIPAIAIHFLLRYAQIFQKSMSSIAPGALELLQSYSWPGNVRELENVMQRSIIAAAGSTIRADDLGLGPQDEDEPEFKDVLDIGDYHPAGSFDRQIQDYKVKLVLSTLRESNGNKTLAARKLGISRVYLHRLIRLTEAGLVLEQPAKDQEIPESGVA